MADPNEIAREIVVTRRHEWTQLGSAFVSDSVLSSMIVSALRKRDQEAAAAAVALLSEAGDFLREEDAPSKWWERVDDFITLHKSSTDKAPQIMPCNHNREGPEVGNG